MARDKARLDVIVQQRAGVSRAKAQGLIRAGRVLDANGVRLDKPGTAVDPDIKLTIQQSPRYVSRGGYKLEAALDHFHARVEGRVAIDVGASTGGFTDCLLQRGARKIYAVDVGYGQLDWSLRQDERVVVMERTNIRNATPDLFPERPDLFVIDCSFISLRLVLPAVKPLLAMPCDGYVLIKPQFEAGREDVGKGGVVRDPAVHQRVIEEVQAAAASVGFQTDGVLPSPILGPAGNVEFLAHLIANA